MGTSGSPATSSPGAVPAASTSPAGRALRALTTLAALGLGLGAGAGPPALAAGETEVLTAVEPLKALPDLRLSLGWERSEERAKVSREWVQPLGGAPQAMDIKELKYKDVMQRLLIGLRVGIYHDLEFHATAPLVLQDDSNISFADGVGPTTSTVFGASSPNANDPSFPLPGASCCARFPITDVPANRSRSGFGDVTFGLGWSPVVDTKDEAYPTITLKGDVTAPTGRTRNPTDQSALPGRGGGGVGLGETVFDLSLSFSKRMRVGAPTLDPYVVFGAALPVATASQRSNGLDPPASGRFVVGTDIVIDQDEDVGTKYSIDLSFGVRYVAAGRTFSELSDYLPGFDPTLTRSTRAPGDATPLDTIAYGDYRNPKNYRVHLDGANCAGVPGVPCGEFTHVDEYLRFKSQVAVDIRPVRNLYFRGGVTLDVATDHFLTGEPAGTDRDPASASAQLCDGAPCVGRVNARNSLGQDERSHYYDPRFDTPGHRFRIEETLNFIVFLAGGARF